jgi:L-alanine-DL-glutamate epimerase-like enolase superfamily enzyme
VVPIGVLDAANNVVVRITTDIGIQGWGEASPFAPITGDTQESNFVNARMLALAIHGKDPLAVEARMQEINAATVGEPSLRSAFDMALYDILGQAAGLPLYKLLGGERRPLRTDITIGMQETVAKTLEMLEECMEMGFDEVKMKVGRPGSRRQVHDWLFRRIPARPDRRRAPGLRPAEHHIPRPGFRLYPENRSGAGRDTIRPGDRRRHRTT